MRDNTGVVYCMKVCSSVQRKSNLNLLQLSNSRVSAHENRIWLRAVSLRLFPDERGCRASPNHHPNPRLTGRLTKTQLDLGLSTGLSILTYMYFPLQLMENITGNWPAFPSVSKANSGMGFRASEEIQPSLRGGLPSTTPAWQRQTAPPTSGTSETSHPFLTVLQRVTMSWALYFTARKAMPLLYSCILTEEVHHPTRITWGLLSISAAVRTMAFLNGQLDTDKLSCLFWIKTPM